VSRLDSLLPMMKLATVVTISHNVAASSARNEKIALLAEAVGKADDRDLQLVAAYLAGVIPQGAFGVGFSSIAALPDPAAEPSLTVCEVDAALTEMSQLSGEGSTSARRAAIEALFSKATATEQEFLSALLLGGLRQGAGEKLMVDAIAKAFSIPVQLTRRAAMLSGDLAEVAVAAHRGGREAVASIGLRLYRPVAPMLAKSAQDVEAGLARLDEAAVDVKLDGARIQVHKGDAGVHIFTRNLNDVTDRLPEIVSLVEQYGADQLVLDGEAIALGADGRPLPFQVTMARFGTSHEGTTIHLSPFFFDVIHIDGVDVFDLPAVERFAILDDIVPETHRVRRVITSDAGVAAQFMGEVLAAGHEGVVLKALDGTYQAGRRGSDWLKVKPVHTLDLVVLAVEWGSGRRKGWLSNIHLGARAADGSFVMLGKTFKGMTDEMLEWQTKRFLELETDRKRHVVYVRPEQVVEIAFDGIQASSRYPGGMALRFARVKGYRDDKTAEEADTIETVRALFGAQ
jgi:DNA ligase-1